MSFESYYLEKISEGTFNADATQHRLVLSFERIYQEMINEVPVAPEKKGLFARFRKQPDVPTGPVKGLYIWGGVGRGKTFIMNLFYEWLPMETKWRIHYHRFMLWVHEQNGKFADLQDPLKHVAKRIRAKNRILFLDEFMVTDIADAMILHGLLKHLCDEGVTLVTTSNIVPNLLYLDGIQRDSFLPAIALLNQHTEILEVDNGTDYRTKTWVCEDIYFSPLGDKADNGLAHCFDLLTQGNKPHPETITVAGRPMQARAVAPDLAWFEFDVLCRSNRSHPDYIELSSHFSTLIIANVPVLSNEDDDAARRWINLIDTAYDYGVNLILSAATTPQNLYTGTRLQQPFERTASRISEMSTLEYLSAEHLHAYALKS